MTIEYTHLPLIYQNLYIGNFIACNHYQWDKTVCCVNCHSKNIDKYSYTFNDDPFIDFEEAKYHILNGARILNQSINENKDKKILVHCHAGMNRCATICGAYAILYKNYNADKTIQYIRNRNREDRNLLAITNPVFEKVLYCLSNLNDKTSYRIQYLYDNIKEKDSIKKNNNNIKYIQYEDYNDNQQTNIKDLIKKK